MLLIVSINDFSIAAFGVKLAPSFFLARARGLLLFAGFVPARDEVFRFEPLALLRGLRAGALVLLALVLALAGLAARFGAAVLAPCFATPRFGTA